MWKCPECNREITYLNYKVSTEGREYGRGDLRNRPETRSDGSSFHPVQEHECEDSENGEWQGEPDYECPECDNEIVISELIWEEENEEEDEENEETEPIKEIEKIGIEENIVTEIEIKWKEFISKENKEDILMSYGAICPKCKYFFTKENTNNYYTNPKDEETCPNCNETFNLYQSEKEIKDKKNKRIIQVATTIKRKKYAIKRI